MTKNDASKVISSPGLEAVLGEDAGDDGGGGSFSNAADELATGEIIWKNGADDGFVDDVVDHGFVAVGDRCGFALAIAGAGVVARLGGGGCDALEVARSVSDEVLGCFI